ncbi:MAG: hypothetical protein HOP34_12395 [Methylococcaceae bacterium]|nr:hypothetical protein [Methylococcaceae bacterium]
MPTKIRWLVLGLIILIVFQIANANSNTIKLSSGQQSVESNYFGLHIHHLAHPTVKTPWPNLKFGTWRLWDAYVNWSYLEPKKGEWDFSKLDQYVEMARTHKVEILLPLGLSPRWASARPNEKSSYGLGNAAEPQDVDNWRNYVRTVATRYKGQIHHYELWNEVSSPGFYSGKQKQLVELARVAYITLKEIDPTIVFISPSVAGDNSHALPWLEQYFKEGGHKYADVVAYHFYVADKEPEAMLSLVYKVKTLTGKYGLSGKPLWNTESGWWIANKDGTPETGAVKGWKRLLSSDAENFVARALILGKSAGIERFYWYAWDNGTMGLIELHSKKFKPAAHAYQQVYAWLVGSVLQNCTQKQTMWTCDLFDAKGIHKRLAWTTGKDLMWITPHTWHISSYQTLDGQHHSTKPGSPITLTQAPMLIIGR